ncbi:hypothetical protein ACOMHN_038755 [Nucella lapillus]
MVMLLFPALWALLLSASYVSRIDGAGSKKVFCYYSSFAQNRQGIGKFLPEDIDPFLCTHLIFAFVDITRDGTNLRPFNRNDAGPGGLYERTIALKDKNPALKVLLAVGGWQIGSKPFIPMISDPSNMRQWIKNVVVYLRKHNFDGFDVDWEFPATRGSAADDKYRYTTLMKGLYEAFAEESRESGREKLLLTMATASGTYFIDTSYEPSKIIPYMDYMLLMTYNYHGQWEKRTGHHSPLLKHRNDPPGEQSELFQNWSIDYWLDMGVPQDKLVVGLATYGMSFTLREPQHHDVHSPAKGGGRMGRYTKETGILAYYEICENIQENGWQTGWIDDQHVPYAYGGNQWVGFDNVDSIKIKADNIMDRDLAGAFVWSVEMDDFNGVCHEGKYPILSTIGKILQPYKGAAIVAPAGKGPAKIWKSRKTTVRTVHSGDSSSEEDFRPKQTSRSGEHGDGDSRRTVSHGRKSSPSSPGPISGRKTSQGSGRRVTWWGKPTWRPKNTRGTKSPWWRRTTPSQHSSTNQKARTTQPVRHTTNWNARPTGRPSPSHVRSLATDSSPEENSVEEKEEETDHSSDSKSSSAQQDHSEQKSSAGSLSGGSVTCYGLGSGLHLHPDDCEKFIICMPGSWLHLPPHVMSCPAGTRFDERIKVCNHADSVPCWN